MYVFSVPMALADFVPVALFAVAAVLMQRDLYNKMPKYAYACFAAGCVDVFLAGFLKALWKLLYAMNLCDFHVLNTMFLPVQSIGFLLLGLGILGLFIGRKKAALMLAAPPVFSGSVVFIMMMVLGLGCLCTCLSILAVKMKKKAAVVLFVLAFVCSMGMGAMSGQDSSQAWVNWVEQSINCVSQLCLMGGVLTLHKAGLKEFAK